MKTVKDFPPVFNNLWLKLLEFSHNHVEICLHYGGVLDLTVFTVVGWQEDTGL